MNQPADMNPIDDQNPMVDNMPDVGGIEGMEGMDGQQGGQVNPKVEMMMDDRAKVRYAEQHNYPMQIVYHSKQSGQTLPPRKLIPIAGQGYEIDAGEGGEYFVAYDSSPTINGGDWQILGNQIKRFLFDNIIALEVIEEFVE